MFSDESDFLSLVLSWALSCPRTPCGKARIAKPVKIPMNLRLPPEICMIIFSSAEIVRPTLSLILRLRIRAVKLAKV